MEAQSQALSFVEDVSRARSAGLSVAASEIGVSDTVAVSRACYELCPCHANVYG